MRLRLLAALVGLTLGACSTPAPLNEAAAQTPPATQSASPSPAPAPVPAAPAAPAPPMVVPPSGVRPVVGYPPISIGSEPISGNTSMLPVPASPAVAHAAAPGQGLLPVCGGAAVQGGLVVCRTLPGANVVVGTQSLAADAAGFVVIGFDRDAPALETVTFQLGSQLASHSFEITPRTFRTTSVDGVPQRNVTPDPEQQARIARERVLINEGYASRADISGYLDAFIWPVEGRISSAWGAQRIINGAAARPHYGIDIAVPTGTPIRAPAGGVVSLVQPDLFQEGGLLMIDHGQGLISVYLHMSRQDVVVGQRVTQGEVVGAVGATGRATGPHLCWRMKWRDRFLDPSLAIQGLALARQTLAPAQQ